MTQKEKFLEVKSYAEFDERREEFEGLKFDKDITRHMPKIFPKPYGGREELYSYLPDGRMAIGGKGNAKKSTETE